MGPSDDPRWRWPAQIRPLRHWRSQTAVQLVLGGPHQSWLSAVMWCAERLTVFEDDRNTALNALVVAREAQNLPVCGWRRQPLAADEHTDSVLATMQQLHLCNVLPRVSTAVAVEDPP